MPTLTQPGTEPVAHADPTARGHVTWRGALVLLMVAVLAGAVSAVAVVVSQPSRPAPVSGAGAAPIASPSKAPKGGPTGGTAGSPVGSQPVPAGYPSAATTGVPAGTALTTHNGDLRITKAGTVVSGMLINGCVVIAASDVTLRDSKVMCSSRHAGVTTNNQYTGTTISAVDIDGMGIATVGLLAKNTTATAVNVYNSGDGVHLSVNATLQDSYVHDLATGVNVHHDVLQTLHGSNATHIRVLHDTLEAHNPQRDDSTVYHLGSGSISDVLVTDSYLDGGHYTIAVDNNTTQHDIVIRDNHFGRHYHFDILAAGNKGSAVTLVGNVFQDNGEAATAASSRGKGLATS